MIRQRKVSTLWKLLIIPSNEIIRYIIEVNEPTKIILMTRKNGPLKGTYSGEGEYKVDYIYPMQKEDIILEINMHIFLLKGYKKRAHACEV